VASVSIKRAEDVDNERLFSVYGMIFGYLGTFLFAIFWAMAAVLKATGNGGTIVQLHLTGLWNTLFWAFPVVSLASVVLGLGLFALKRYKEAAGIAALPTIGVVVYYLALVQFHVGAR
jgi:magnesium-transporting ATPase (P-type)